MNVSELIRTCMKEWQKKWFDIFLDRYNTHKYTNTTTLINISQNINLSPEYIKLYPTFPWVWYAIASNPNLTEEYIDYFLTEQKWSTAIIKERLSINPAITASFVERHPNVPWNFYYLSQNPSFTEKEVAAHLDWKWDWGQLARRLPYSFFDTIDDEWFEQLSNNESITMDIIDKYSDKRWDWSALLKNAIITSEWVDQKDFLLDEHTKWYYYSMNKHLSGEFIRQNIHKNYEWAWFYLSRQSNMFDYIRDYPQWDWDWEWVSKNPCVTYDFVLLHREKNWNWNHLFQYSMIYKNVSFIEFQDHYIKHPNFSLTDLDHFHMDDVTFLCLSYHSLDNARNHFIDTLVHQKILEYIRVSIHPELIGYMYHPKYIQRLLDNDQRQRWKL